MTRSCEADPRVRLPADAVPRRRRAAHGAADPPRRARPRRGRAARGSAAGSPDLFEVTPTTTADALVARFDAAGELAGGEGRFGLVTRDGAWLLTARAARVRARCSPAGGDAVRALDVTPPRRRRSSRSPGSTPPRSRAASGSATRSPRPRPSRWSRRATDGADAAFLLEPTPVASILDVSARGRRDAPEVDLLLSQGPHRARAQPARVVGPSGRTDDRPRPPPTASSPAPRLERPARPQGRDRARRARPVHRVVAARAALATQADPVRPRRARRVVGVGALPPPLRRPRLGGPRAQPAQPLLVADRGPRRRSTSGPTPRTSSRRWSGSARRSSWSGTGSAACWSLKALERVPASGLRADRARSCRATCATPRAPTSCATSPTPTAARSSAGRRCPRSSCASTAT